MSPSATADAGVERWAEPVYLDASALVKLFVPESESDELNQALAGLTDVIVSDLALTEMASALGRRTREQLLTREEAQRLYREASKLHASSLHAELTPPIHRRAERLMLSLAIPLRALDALHLATALDAEAATVVTFDPRLRVAAATQGLFAGQPPKKLNPDLLPPPRGQVSEHVWRSDCLLDLNSEHVTEALQDDHIATDDGRASCAGCKISLPDGVHLCRRERRDAEGVNWRRGWDSNPRALSDKTLSRRPRYDHFGTSPLLTPLDFREPQVDPELVEGSRPLRGFAALACPERTDDLLETAQIGRDNSLFYPEPPVRYHDELGGRLSQRPVAAPTSNRSSAA